MRNKTAPDDGLLRSVEQFLYREARLLDDRRFHEWLLIARYGEGAPERLQRLFRDSDRTRILGLIPVQAIRDFGDMGHAPLAIPDTALSAGESTFGHAG